MDYPISATITDELVYDREAKLVINTNPDVYMEKRLEVRTAGELSRAWRDLENKEQRLAIAQGSINLAEEYIKENYEDIGEEHVEALAGILGFDLSTTVDVTFQVEITATISMPIGKKFSDLSEYDFDIELTCNDSDYEIEDYDPVIERMKES